MSVRHPPPDKHLRRPAEVCVELDIQPYVLKFWESEFPQLGRRVGAKRNYGRKEVAFVKELRRLLEEDGLSLSDARAALAQAFPDLEGGPASAPPVDMRATSHAPDPQLAHKLDQALEELRIAKSEAKSAEARASQLQKFRDDREQLRQEIAGLKAELTHRGGDQGRVAELDLSLARAREEQAALVAAARTEAEAAEARLHGLQDELRRAWDETGPLRERTAALERELQALSVRLNEQDQELAALRQEALRAAELAAEAEGLRRLATEHSTALDLAHQERARLEQDLTETARQAEDSARQIGQMAEAVEQVAALRGEREALLGRAAELTARIVELERERAALRDAVERRAGETPVLELQLAEARAERDDLRERTTRELAAALEEIRGLIAAAEDLQLSIGAASVAADRGSPKDWADPARILQKAAESRGAGETPPARS